MDKDIIRRIRQGEDTAFADLYKNYSEYALRVASAVTGSAALAADAVQETFIRIYKNMATYDEEKPFKPWLYRILLNECNRLLKHRSKTIFISDFQGKEVVAPIESHSFEEYEELYKAIQRLPEANRIPVILKYLNGFSEKEIAEVLSINVNTVKSRLLRGRQKLRELLEEFEVRGLNHG